MSEAMILDFAVTWLAAGSDNQFEPLVKMAKNADSRYGRFLAGAAYELMISQVKGGKSS